MSHYGICAKINGVPCGLILRDPMWNGRYQAVFEREFASLEEIEAIDWARPEVEVLKEPAVLPEGFGFEAVRITYDSGTRAYTVELNTAEQFLGDVSGYQAQVAELREQAASAQARAEEMAGQVSEALQDAEERDAALAAAYEKGVESNG